MGFGQVLLQLTVRHEGYFNVRQEFLDGGKLVRVLVFDLVSQVNLLHLHLFQDVLQNIDEAWQFLIKSQVNLLSSKRYRHPRITDREPVHVTHVGNNSGNL